MIYYNSYFENVDENVLVNLKKTYDITFSYIVNDLKDINKNIKLYLENFIKIIKNIIQDFEYFHKKIIKKLNINHDKNYIIILDTLDESIFCLNNFINTLKYSPFKYIVNADKLFIEKFTYIFIKKLCDLNDIMKNYKIDIFFILIYKIENYIEQIKIYTKKFIDINEYICMPFYLNNVFNYIDSVINLIYLTISDNEYISILNFLYENCILKKYPLLDMFEKYPINYIEQSILFYENFLNDKILENCLLKYNSIVNNKKYKNELLIKSTNYLRQYDWCFDELEKKQIDKTIHYYKNRKNQTLLNNNMIFDELLQKAHFPDRFFDWVLDNDDKNIILKFMKR